MASVNIKVNVTSNKKEYEKVLEQVAEKVLTMWGMQAESAAKRLCPVDTGLLRNSITYALAGQAANTTEYQDDAREQTGFYSGQAQADRGGPRHVYIGTNVEYAIYQELGTVNMPGGNPFLGPAIEQNIEYYRSILKSELKKVL